MLCQKEVPMAIRKIAEFKKLLKGDSILLSAAPDSIHDAIPEMSTHYNEKKPGDEVHPHFHNRVEVYVFVSGKALVMAGEDIALVSTGDVAIAPVGISHAIKVIGSEPLAYFALNSPPSSMHPVLDAPKEIVEKWGAAKKKYL
jgi:mannose-6-phosphate isomerase-like protein (cupin superfamily)